jgi:DNA-directed RNA polymerase specialized sigma24 family protein
MHRGPIRVGPESVSDDELVSRFLDAPSSQGGHEAFEQLWQRHRRYVEQTIRAMLYLAPDGYDRQAFGQDALQQASVNLLQRMHGYRGPERFRQYLKRVAETSVLDERRAVLARMRGIVGQEGPPGRDPAPPDETRGDAIAFRSCCFFC